MSGAATKFYIVYSALLLESDNRTNMAVFLDPTKIMNTVCGLVNNTDRYYQRLHNIAHNIYVDGFLFSRTSCSDPARHKERGYGIRFPDVIFRWQCNDA